MCRKTVMLLVFLIFGGFTVALVVSSTPSPTPNGTAQRVNPCALFREIPVRFKAETHAHPLSEIPALPGLGIPVLSGDNLQRNFQKVFFSIERARK